MTVFESTSDFVIRSGASLSEVKDLWWDRMKDLGWVFLRSRLFTTRFANGH